MIPYLVQHRPHLTQYRARTAKPTGLTVIHTAESILDTIGPDTGAENVAAYMVRRDSYGSYHDLVDSDTALQLVRYEDAAFQDGSGSNHVALSISFACRTSDWTRMTPQKRAGFLAQGAVAFRRQQAWLRANNRPTTPLRRITRQQSEAGVPGFISHAERDPSRRTDPGSDFPWDEWFQACGATPEVEDDLFEPKHADWLHEIREVVMRRKPGGVQDNHLAIRGLQAQVGALTAVVGRLATGSAATFDEILAAARQGATEALDARIADADITLTVTPEEPS